MIGHRCQNCLWWDNQHKRLGDLAEQGYGYCRQAKTMIFHKGKHWVSWGLADRDDFCHKFRTDTSGEAK